MSAISNKFISCNLLYRYSTNQDAVETTVLEVVKETLNRRQAPDNINKNFLKLLSSAAGLVEVRTILFFPVCFYSYF